MSPSIRPRTDRGSNTKMSLEEFQLHRIQQRRGALLVFGMLAVLGGLVARLVYINTVLSRELGEVASRQQQGAATIPARRGIIFDARGRMLAVSRLLPDVYVDPLLVRDAEALARELAIRLERRPEEIAHKIKQNRPDPAGPVRSRFVILAEGVDSVTADAVRNLRNPAVGLSDQSRREYPLRNTLSHVLGWVGKDGYGLEGLERQFDGHLRGQDGRRPTIRDARRRALRRSDESTVPPADGGHLVLTIDAEIQRLAEEALARAVANYDAESGVAVIMSPTDGDILAMVCHPGFDPHEPGRSAAKSRRNRAVTDPVEPGSAFKPIVLCGALEAGVVSLEEKIDCGSGARSFGRRVVRDTRANGVLDLRGIITRSSNIGMSHIAERLGNARIFQTLRRFGLGQPTGVDLPGEDAGVVRELREWTYYSTASVAMGYEVMVTPLQLLNAYSAIVNEGILVRPRLVRQLLAADGNVVESFDPPANVGRAVSAKVARMVAQDLLVSAVEHGSGRQAQTGPYRVLGKTGTAKLTYAGRRGYEPNAYLSVFVGAAPASDPRLVALAMVRRPNPEAGYFGGDVAAPAVGEMLAGALAYLEVPPDEPVKLSESQATTDSVGF